MKRLLLICSALAACVAFTASAGADSNVTVVMSGLDSPRGLAFGPQGALYVAEAGRGGFGSENPFCFTGPLGAVRCYGPTGAVSRLWHGIQSRVATGLPSHANPNGSRADGPHDISMLGVGTAYVTVGLEGDPTVRDQLAQQIPDIAGFAGLVKVEPSGQWRSVADLGAYEEANNPDGRLNDDGSPFLDSNPYGVLASPGGPLVTDAGGNTLLRVNANGDISLLAVFQSRGSTPPRPSGAPPQFDQFTDAVPTAVSIGPDGAYYVSELTGVPFVDRKANIYRVLPDEAPRLFLTDEACLAGFKMLIDLAFDTEGNLYALQYATGALQQMGTGILIRITPDKSVSSDTCAQYRAGARTVVLGGPGQFQLAQPTSIAVGPDGALYISNHGVSVGGGEVLRVEP